MWSFKKSAWVEFDHCFSPVINPCELHLELWCHSLAHFKVLDGEGRVSGQRSGKDQGAVAVDVLPSYALHFFCHGAVNGAESTLLWGLGEVKRGRQTQSRWKGLDAGSKTEPSQSRLNKMFSLAPIQVNADNFFFVICHHGARKETSAQEVFLPTREDFHFLWKGWSEDQKESRFCIR